MKTINIDDSKHKILKSLAAMKNLKIRNLVDEAIDYIIKKYDDADLTTIYPNGKVVKEYYGKN